MRVFERVLVAAGDMSGNLTSPVQSFESMQMAMIQAVWTGTPTGTLSLQVSNDQLTWSTYTPSAMAVSGTPGDGIWTLSNIGFPYLRVIYTRTSGTGALNVTVNGKGD